MRKKYLYVLLGMLAMMLLGALYTWSIICVPIKISFPGWSTASMSLCFTLCMICFCVGGFFNAYFLGKYPLWVIIGICTVIYCGGFILSAIWSSIASMYLGFGIMVGLTTGMLYNIIMGNVVPWFPEKTGFIGGLLLMCFGLGSFNLGKIFQALISVENISWQKIFLSYTSVSLIIFSLCAMFLRKPTIKQQKNADGKNALRDYTAKEMLKTKVFWLLFLWGVGAAGAGYVLVAHANGILHEASPLISASLAATLVGLLSVANGLGRAIYGYLYDKIGYQKGMFFLEGLLFLCALFIFLGLKSGSVAFTTAGFICGGLFFSGVAANTPPLINEFFGRKYYAINYSIINLCVLFASFGSTIAGSIYDKSASYVGVAVLLAIIFILTSGILFTIKNPQE